MSNQFKTVLLLGVLTGLLLLIGGIFGGKTGLTIALVIALLLNFITYWYSDKIVLALYRAKEAKKEDYPELHEIVEEVASRASAPKPKVCVVPGDYANAFATGRNEKKAVIAVTNGIMKLLDYDELKGVIAHEMAHIKNKDMLISTIAAVIAGAIGYIAMIARFSAIFGGGRDRDAGGIVGLIVLSILIPIMAMIIRMGISRSREYLADEKGAKIIQNPIPLADALAKLESSSKRNPMKGNEATSHMFIVNPFSGKGLINLLSTHPPVHSRIGKLRAMKL